MRASRKVPAHTWRHVGTGAESVRIGAGGRQEYCLTMADNVLIPLPGIGTLELTRETYEAALRPLAAYKPTSEPPEAQNALVTAKTLAANLSLPVSCLYEYAKAGRIPCVRA